MTTEKIHLPDFVIANLYTDNLVIGNDVQKVENKALPVEQPVAKPIPSEKSEPPKQWYLGNNGKQITILIKEPDVAYINDRHLQFLSNILNACKLNLGDVALVNQLNQRLLFADLKQKLQPKYLILFDVSTKEIQLPFTIPDYQVQAYDQCQFLLAPSLSAMDGDSQEAKMEKSKLWISLKKMFQL